MRPLTARTNSLRTSWASGEHLRVVGLDDHLRQAVAVAQVQEHLIGIGPVAVDPAVEDDGLADVGLAQLAAGVGAS